MRHEIYSPPEHLNEFVYPFEINGVVEALDVALFILLILHVVDVASKIETYNVFVAQLVLESHDD